MSVAPLTVIPGVLLKALMEPPHNLPVAPNIFKTKPGAAVALLPNPPGAVYMMAAGDVLANVGPRSKTKSTYGFTAPAAF
jgi:hypothetical protein